MKHLFTTLISGLALTAATSAFAQSGEVRTSGQVSLINDLSVELSLDEENVTVTLTGPSDRWFAIGFNALGMMPGTDVIFYADGADGTGPYDAHLVGQNAPVEDDSQDWEILENNADGNFRTVVATRPLDTGDSDDYVFDFEAPTLTIIYAHGTSASTGLAFHGGNRGSEVLEFESTVSATNGSSLAERFTLFPNPAVNEINFAVNGSIALETIRIFDINARQIKAIRTGLTGERVSISVDDLPSGVYFAEINTREDRAVKRFVVE